MKQLFIFLVDLLFISTVQAQVNPLSVNIGSQTWMVKNLDVDHYRNGDPIPEVKDSATWSKLITGAWCYYDNHPANGKIYGKLYNWYAVNDPRGLALKGWHIPNDAEWKKLFSSLGGDNVASNKMREKGTIHWQDPNSGATNSSGFTALPGGLCSPEGIFASNVNYGYWWSSSSTKNWVLMNFVNPYVIMFSVDAHHGLSVRCIKD